MASIRRFGASMLAPEVMPRPQLGRGAEATFQVFEQGLKKANDFLRPAVIRTQEAKGEAEALAAVQESGPKFDLVQTRGPADVAVDVIEGQKPRKGMEPTTENAAILGAAKRHGVDPVALSVIAQLESGGDPTAQNPNSSAGGLFQFIDSTAQQYGLQDRFDPSQAADAGARLARDNARVLANALGRQPNVGELYLAHQQGAGGASKLLANPSARAVDIVGADAVRLNGGTPDMTAQEFASLWIDKANKKAGGEGISAISVNMPTGAEYELQQTNASSFEPRVPFTIRDQAFNAAADRVIQAEAMTALEQGMAAAQQKANGDLGILKDEMEKVRATVMGGLPNELPGLKTKLQESFSRGVGVAQQQAIALKERQVIAQQTIAMNQALGAITGEAERLALTGASGADIAAHLTSSQDALVQFGPREGFTLNGQEYPADPSRAGTMTPAAIAQQLGQTSSQAQKIMIEAEFQKSAAPGQFVEEFRRQVMAGNSPLPAGESLKLLSQLESRAHATESQRRTAANAARTRLKKATDTRINDFVSLTEAGVPVAIPQQERQQILSDLAPFPELQRDAMEQFAVADAAVITHGMSGPELVQYVDSVRNGIAEGVARGEIDLEGVAVINSLEDRLKKVQDAVTAEMVGLPIVEQLARDGASVQDVNYDGLREQALGKSEILERIDRAERLHVAIEAMEGMNADEREAALEAVREELAGLAADGVQFGAQAAETIKVVDALGDWSEQRQKLAANDAVKFAEASGIPLPSFDGAEGLGDIGSVLAERVAAVQPAALGEGVATPVPLTRAEVDGIAEIYKESPRGAQMEFIGSIAALGEEQADAIFAKVGGSAPVLFAAGTVYAGGNQSAASIMLRGDTDAKLEGGGPVDLATARSTAIGELLQADMIHGESIKALDTAALAYARGLAMQEGGRAITVDDLQVGFEMAVGQQEDGTGGVAATSYGTTIAPKGWVGSLGFFGGEGRSIESAINSIDDDKLSRMAQGMVVDIQGRPIGADALLRSIEGLRPSPNDPYILIPTDAEGAVFLTDSGGGHLNGGVLQIDLRDFE